MIFAAVSVCPSYEDKYAAINSTAVNHEDFQTIIKDAFADLQQAYTAEVTSSMAEYSSGVSADVQSAIDSNGKHVSDRIAGVIKSGQTLLKDLFQNPQSTDVQYIQSRIGRICDKVEHDMRGRLDRLRYFFAKLTNERESNHDDEIAMLRIPNDVLATIRTAVNESAHQGNSAEKMYTDGVASIYDRMHKEVSDYQASLQHMVGSFERTITPKLAANEDVKEDLYAVHEYLETIMAYKVPEIDTLDKESYGVDVTMDKLIDQVAESVGKFYSTAFFNAYVVTDYLFMAMDNVKFELPSISDSIIAWLMDIARTPH